MAKNQLSFKSDLSRHPHDVNAGYTASASTGMIIPQYFDILGPNDAVYFTTHMFARLQDIVTAFLGEIDMHVDYFFVPLQMLYTPFGQQFALTKDFVSSAVQPNFSYLPYLQPSFFQEGKQNVHFTRDDECYGVSAMRLLDALDFNPLVRLSSESATVSGYNKKSDDINDDFCNVPARVSPWALLAYQAIYQKYFRNDAFESLRVDAYNIDRYFAGSTPSNPSSANILRLRYCQRPSDYFTDLRPSPITSLVNNYFNTNGETFPENGGSVTQQSFVEFLKVNDYLGFSSNFAFQGISVNDNITSPYDIANSAATAGGVISVSNNSPSGANYAKLSAENIRALFAADKFARIYGRADKTYDAQILAHFGVKIPHDVKHDLTHIKHYHAVLQSDPVYSTSTVAGGSSLGQVGGQGSVSLNTKQEKFVAPVHGVFMCVAYFVSKPRYFGTFSKLHMLLDRTDFPIPEFDKLGAQPLYAYETAPEFISNDDSIASTHIGFRFGWQNRYEQFKRKYDRTSICYVNPIMFHQNRSEQGITYSNIYEPWVLSRSPFYTNYSGYQTTPINGSYLFESPHALDGVMSVPFSGEWSNEFYASPHLAFQRDPLLTEFFCECKKVSWMSETGEPNL